MPQPRAPQLLPSRRAIFRAVCLGMVGSVAPWLGGCQSVDRTAASVVAVQAFPPVSHVAASAVLPMAEASAAVFEGDFVLAGVGTSMAPTFQPGTAIVVRPTSYFMLRAGVPVVYCNRAGRLVAHVTARKTRAGWVVAGLNNPEPDDERVTPENLVGVVKCAFVPLAGDALAMGGPRRVPTLERR